MDADLVAAVPWAELATSAPGLVAVLAAVWKAAQLVERGIAFKVTVALDEDTRLDLRRARKALERIAACEETADAA